MFFHVIQISCNISAAIQIFSGFTPFSSRKINYKELKKINSCTRNPGINPLLANCILLCTLTEK